MLCYSEFTIGAVNPMRTFSFRILLIFIFQNFFMVSPAVSQDAVMFGDNNKPLDEGYQGKVKYCEVDGIRTGRVHTDGVEKIMRGGQLDRTTTWKDCRKNGEAKEYDSGFITEEGVYLDDRKTGKWTLYVEDTGEIWKEINYKNDKYDGLYKEYSRNTGQLIEEIEFKEGRKNGYAKYFSKGKLYLTRNWVDNKANGAFELLDNLGEIRLARGGIKGDSDFYQTVLYMFICVNGQRHRDACKASPLYSNTTGMSRDDTYTFNNVPIKVTGSYQADIAHGDFKISDPNDGHVYSEFKYRRGGKSGEFKITNKNGLIIYSVNCLPGGVDYIDNCKKDGKEELYVKSQYKPNHDWYLVSDTVWEAGRRIKEGNLRDEKLYPDPFNPRNKPSQKSNDDSKKEKEKDPLKKLKKLKGLFD